MRIRLTILLILVTGIANAYDFSAVCPSGQTLYYSIVDGIKHRVSVTYPGPVIDSAYLNVVKPTGSLSIPEQVSFEGDLYTVVSVGTCAFAKCSGLNGVLTIPSTIISLDSYAFLHCGHISTLVFNAKHCTEAFAAFEGCRFDTIVIGDEVTFIPDGLFANSNGVESLVFPNSVRSIGARACFNCPNLKTVVLPDYLEQIGDYAFCDCFSLDSITTINSNTIGKGAFRNAVNLANVDLGAALEFIDDEAFFNCKSIASLLFDDNVMEIGDYAFYYCDLIDTVYCHPLLPPKMGDNVFSEGILSGVLCVYCSAMEVYGNSNGWDGFDEICAFDPYTLSVVSNNAFWGDVSVFGYLYCFGDVAVIEAIPFENFCFSGWNDGIMDNPRRVSIESDTLFVAYFSADTTLACSEGTERDMFSVRVEKNKVFLLHAKGKNVSIYNIVGGLVYYGKCEEEETCIYLTQNGVVFVCVEGESRCHKLLLKGGGV